MAVRIRTIVYLVLLIFLSAWAGKARSGIDPVPWSVPLASGFDNPIFWVLFNPQPEPPGDEMVPMSLDVSVPTALVFEVNNSSEGWFHLEFAIEDLSYPISGFQYLPGTRGFEVKTLGSAGPLYTAGFSFETAGFSFGSGGAFLSPGSDVMFNPQPEPPGFPGVIVEFSLLDAATGAPPPAGSEVAMTLKLSGPGGQLISLTPVSVTFTRGNANADADTDISDAIGILSFLFTGGKAPPCRKAADITDDGTLDISDGVALLSHLFLGGKAPPEPFAACGIDPTPDELSCESFEPCR
jgi:hypothetical protein